MKDSGIARFLYPGLPLERPTVHNLILTVFTLAFGVITLILAWNHTTPNPFELVSRLMLAGILLVAAMVTVCALLSKDKDRMIPALGVMNSVVSAIAIFVGAVLIASRAEVGVVMWLDLGIALTNLLWLWRASQQALRGQ